MSAATPGQGRWENTKATLQRWLPRPATKGSNSPHQVPAIHRVATGACVYLPKLWLPCANQTTGRAPARSNRSDRMSKWEICPVSRGDMLVLSRCHHHPRWILDVSLRCRTPSVWHGGQRTLTLACISRRTAASSWLQALVLLVIHFVIVKTSHAHPSGYAHAGWESSGVAAITDIANCRQSGFASRQRRGRFRYFAFCTGGCSGRSKATKSNGSEFGMSYCRLTR
jgi:hypothetical protein